MSLFIKVYVGSKDDNILVADCVAYNNSGLADVSNYKFRSIDVGNEQMGIPTIKIEGEIKDHKRNQTVWSLVEKIAKESQVKNESN